MCRESGVPSSNGPRSPAVKLGAAGGGCGAGLLAPLLEEPHALAAAVGAPQVAAAARVVAAVVGAVVAVAAPPHTGPLHGVHVAGQVVVRVVVQGGGGSGVISVLHVVGEAGREGGRRVRSVEGGEQRYGEDHRQSGRRSQRSVPPHDTLFTTPELGGSNKPTENNITTR